MTAPRAHPPNGRNPTNSWATTNTGTTEAPNNTAAVRIDTVKPVSSASGPNQVTNASPFTINYTASDAAPSSGLDKVELWVKGPSDLEIGRASCRERV